MAGSGALPPMNAQDWNDEFARYRQIPQYAQLKGAIARYQANGNRYIADGNGW